MRPARTAALAAALVLVLAGCGIGPTGVVRSGDKPLTLAGSVRVTMYLVDGHDRLVPVVRPGLPGHPYYAVTQLGGEPTPAEKRRGLRNAVPRLELRPASMQNGPVTVQRRSTELHVNVVTRGAPAKGDKAPSWSRLALAQVACTAETIPGVSGVRLTGLVSVEGTNVVVVTGVLDDSGRGWELLRCADFRDLTR
ncbi:hypothetical protein ABZ801_07465 [Actinomadura sp. NPDC047616]|uniref:hypothetical protein n=1 Tax=Actinomadura sp. NPDC047616 TaxID=3155914 RepID=UPI0033EAA825